MYYEDAERVNDWRLGRRDVPSDPVIRRERQEVREARQKAKKAGMKLAE
jgi:hypothetical protein